MYQLNAITDISYITFVNLTKGISTEILTKLRNGSLFECGLNHCSLLIKDFKSGLNNVIITYKYIYRNGKWSFLEDIYHIITCSTSLCPNFVVIYLFIYLFMDLLIYQIYRPTPFLM